MTALNDCERSAAWQGVAGEIAIDIHSLGSLDQKSRILVFNAIGLPERFSNFSEMHVEWKKSRLSSTSYSTIR